MKTTCSRRAFLKALGAGGALVPLLEADRGFGATAFPKRVLFVVTPNGVIQSRYWPSGTRHDFAWPANSIGHPLQEIKGDIIVPRGINMQSAKDDPHVFGGHDNFTHILVGQLQSTVGTGTGHSFKGTKNGGAPSIDHVLAQRLNPPTKFKTLAAAVMVQWGAKNQARISWSARDVAVTPQEDPYKLYDALFTGVAGAPTGGSAAETERLFRERRSMLDLVGKDLVRFRANLSREDQLKLDAHTASIRELEKRFDPKFAAQVTCTKPTLQELAMGMPNPQSMPNYPLIGRLQMDLLVEAFACDQTRIATLQWSNAAANNVIFTWLGGIADDKRATKYFTEYYDHHTISHFGSSGNGPDGEVKYLAERWYHEQLVYLVKRLKARREGAGTLLDNTLVVWMNNMHDGGAHSHGPNLPVVLAGRCGGYFETGQFLTLPAVPHNRLLLTAAHAMGATDLEAVGDPRYCVGGPIAEMRA